MLHSHKHYCLYPPNNLIPRPLFILQMMKLEVWETGNNAALHTSRSSVSSKNSALPRPKARSHIHSYLINHSGIGNEVSHSTFLPLPTYLHFPDLIPSFSFIFSMKSFIRCVCTSLPGTTQLRYATRVLSIMERVCTGNTILNLCVGHWQQGRAIVWTLSLWAHCYWESPTSLQFTITASVSVYPTLF